MKAKTVSKILTKVFKEFCESITDPVTKTLVEKNSIITGGCIASMLLQEKVNDYDIYFTNKETAEAVAHYYVNQFLTTNATNLDIKVVTEEDRVRIKVGSAGVASEPNPDNYQYFETLPDDADDAIQYTESVCDALEKEPSEGKEKYRTIFLSDNAITLSNKVQLIIRFYGDAEQIHTNYDFVHCTNYWESKTKELTLRQAALECLLSRELIYIGSKYPLCSIIRTRKFIRRSWSITAGQYLKMMMQLNALDLTNLDVLEDQLTGVDTAYFTELIRKLREGGAETVDKAYLVTIIDRMF